ncbi:hypothetical protein DFH09DRAFT_1421716 [Mycena vulgaris]|nr:hypothetical protein DFH09DRAFT_1421716 [Mycena vulgaris]
MVHPDSLGTLHNEASLFWRWFLVHFTSFFRHNAGNILGPFARRQQPAQACLPLPDNGLTSDSKGVDECQTSWERNGASEPPSEPTKHTEDTEDERNSELGGEGRQSNRSSEHQARSNGMGQRTPTLIASKSRAASAPHVRRTQPRSGTRDRTRQQNSARSSRPRGTSINDHPRSSPASTAHARRHRQRAARRAAHNPHKVAAHDGPPHPHTTAASPPYTRLRWPSRRAHSAAHAHARRTASASAARAEHLPLLHPHHPQSQSCTRRASHESALMKTAWHPHLQRRSRRASASSATRHARIHSARTLRLRLPHPACARASPRIRTRPVSMGHTSRAASHPHSRASVRCPSCTPARTDTTWRSICARWAPHHRRAHEDSSAKSNGSADGAPPFKPSTLSAPAPFSTPARRASTPTREAMTASKTRRIVEEAPGRARTKNGREEAAEGAAARRGERRRRETRRGEGEGGETRGGKEDEETQVEKARQHGVREEAREAGSGDQEGVDSGRRDADARRKDGDGGEATKEQGEELWGGRTAWGRSEGGRGEAEKKGRQGRHRTGRKRMGGEGVSEYGGKTERGWQQK